MFRRFPVFDRLISWTKPDAPFEPGTREYEAYDHNSLLARIRATARLVPRYMDRAFDVPARPRWSRARRRSPSGPACRCATAAAGSRPAARTDGFVLTTSDGEYRCKAAVFALGVTEPWNGGIRGADEAPHYVETAGAGRVPRASASLIVGKRNSGFELANGLLPWAREIVLVSPRPVRFAVLARSPLRVRYLQPYEEFVRGGSGALVVDAAIERIERRATAITVVTNGHDAGPASCDFEADEVIVATGFGRRSRDLPALGVATIGRRPHPGADAVLGERLGARRSSSRATSPRARPGCRSRAWRATRPR